MKNHTPRVVIGMALAMSALLAVPGQAQDTQVFTKAQADAGQKEYDGQCAMCHGAELLGPDAPALVGTDVMHNFSTAAGLYGYFSVAMPPQAPGMLGEETYLNILAYILQANGAQPGETPITADKLESIDLVAVTTAGGGQPSTEPSQEESKPATDVPQAYTWGKTLPTKK